MSLGDDIKSTYEEVGAAFTIIRYGGTNPVSGEYLDFDENRQVTKPFIREFFLEASFPYDTAVQSGDGVEITIDGRVFLVMNRTPEIFENEVISYQSVLYKTNVSGEIQRASGERDPHTYQYEESFVPVGGGHGLLTESLYGNELDQDSELGELGIVADELYISANLDVQPMDRFQVNPPTGNYYKVEVVKKGQYDNVLVCKLTEDTR